MALEKMSVLGWTVTIVGFAYLLGAFDKRADQRKYPIPPIPGGPPTMALPPGGGPVPEPPTTAGAMNLYVGPLVSTAPQVAFVSDGTTEAWVWWYAPASQFVVTTRRAGVVAAAWLPSIVLAAAASRPVNPIVSRQGELPDGTHTIGLDNEKQPEAAVIQHRQGAGQLIVFLTSGDFHGGGDPSTVVHIGFYLINWTAATIQSGGVPL